MSDWEEQLNRQYGGGQTAVADAASEDWETALNAEYADGAGGQAEDWEAALNAQYGAEEPHEHGLVGGAASGFARGAVNLAGSMGGAAAAVGHVEKKVPWLLAPGLRAAGEASSFLGSKVADWSRETVAETPFLQPSESVKAQGYAPDSFGESGKWLVERAPEVLPQLLTQFALAAATHGVSVPAQMAMFAAPAAIMEGGSAYNDAMAKGSDPDTAALQSAVTGVGSGALEAIPFLAYFRKIPGMNKVMGPGLKRLAGVAAGAGAEGITEALQELWGAVTEYAVQNDPEALAHLGERMAGAGLLGAAVGGPMGAVNWGGEVGAGSKPSPEPGVSPQVETAGPVDADFELIEGPDVLPPDFIAPKEVEPEIQEVEPEPAPPAPESNYSTEAKSSTFAPDSPVEVMVEVDQDQFEWVPGKVRGGSGKLVEVQVDGFGDEVMRVPAEEVRAVSSPDETVTAAKEVLAEVEGQARETIEAAEKGEPAPSVESAEEELLGSTVADSATVQEPPATDKESSSVQEPAAPVKESLTAGDYFRGDKIEYTGVVTDDGLREFRYLEGHKKGQTGHTVSKAEKDANAKKKQEAWKSQQEQFVNLHPKPAPNVSKPLPHSEAPVQETAKGGRVEEAPVEESPVGDAKTILAEKYQITIEESMTTPKRAGKKPRPVFIVDGSGIHYHGAELRKAGGKKFNGKWSFWEEPSADILETLESGKRDTYAEKRAAQKERAEARAEKYEAWSESATKKSAQEWEKGDLREEKSGIPMGQPILVGHHSEKRHRRAIERADKAWGRAVELGKKSERHTWKAAGARNTAVDDANKPAAFMQRRIDDAEKELRDIARKLERLPEEIETHEYYKEHPHAAEAFRKQMENAQRENEEKRDYWKELLADKGGVQYSRENVKAEDRVKIRRTWSIVKRANPKTVTIVIAEGGAKGMELKYEYAEIQEHKAKESPQAAKEKARPKPSAPIKAIDRGAGSLVEEPPHPVKPSARAKSLERSRIRRKASARQWLKDVGGLRISQNRATGRFDFGEYEHAAPRNKKGGPAHPSIFRTDPQALKADELADVMERDEQLAPHFAGLSPQDRPGKAAELAGKMLEGDWKAVDMMAQHEDAVSDQEREKHAEAEYQDFLAKLEVADEKDARARATDMFGGGAVPKAKGRPGGTQGDMLATGPVSAEGLRDQALTDRTKGPMRAEEEGQLDAFGDDPYQGGIGLTQESVKKAWGAVTNAPIVKAFYRGRRTLENSAPGRAAIELGERIMVSKERMAYRQLRALEKAMGGKLSWFDKHWMTNNFKDAYEAGKEMPNARIQAFAEAWTKIHNAIGERMEELEVQIHDPEVEGGKRAFVRRIPNYFPRMPTQEVTDAMAEGKGDLYDALMDAFPRWGLPVDALTSAKDIPFSEHWYKAIETPRVGNMPTELPWKGKTYTILRKNPFDVIASYIQHSARRLAIIEHMGQDTAEDFAIRLARDIEKAQGSEAAGIWIGGVWPDLQGIPVTKLDKLLPVPFRALESLVRAGQLSLATVSNIGGYMPIGVRYGTLEAARNFGRVVAADARHVLNAASRGRAGESKTWAYLDAMADEGAWLGDTIAHTTWTEGLEGTSGNIARKALNLTLFNAINRNINKVAALSAEKALQDAIRALRVPQFGPWRRVWGMDANGLRNMLMREFDFTEADVDRMIKGGIGKADLARVVQKARQKINITGESPLDKPHWMNDGLAKRIFAYSSYLRSQGNQLVDVIYYAKQGNVRPLATTLFGYAGMGLLVKTLKDLIYRREKEDEDWWAKFAEGYMEMGTLGLVGGFGENVYYKVKFGDRSMVSMPAVDAIVGLAFDLVKAMNKLGLEAEYRAAVRQVSIFRAIDAHLEGPYWQHRHGKKGKGAPAPPSYGGIRRTTRTRRSPTRRSTRSPERDGSG